MRKMFGAINQFSTTMKFFFYGKSHFTQTGYQENRKAYAVPDILEAPSLRLDGKNYIISGANSGLGKELTTFLASKGATCYMICRSRDRAEAAKAEIFKKTNNNNLHLLIGDCGLESDVRRIWSEFQEHATKPVSLSGLVCNAGALMKERTVTAEGVEVTAATHLIFGSYLLGSLAIPTLDSTPNSRLILVSSGGMYNTKFPSWEEATATGAGAAVKYDGQLTYAYAKRAQVLLAERWAAMHPKFPIVSCHPGWAQTEGVDAAYGDSKSYLSPLRTVWEGTEGIAYLCVIDTDKLQSGAFYLDREPQRKHLGGLIFSSGSFTENTNDEVDELMTKLKQWSDTSTRPSAIELERLESVSKPLKPISTVVDIKRFCIKWYVLSSIPTPFEHGVSNSVEGYTWDEARNIICVSNTYTSSSGADAEVKMHATITNPPINSQWSLNPKVGIYLPLGLTYLVAELAEDYSYAIIGVPDRSYMWVLVSEKPSAGDGASSSDSMFERTASRAEFLGFDKAKIQRMSWTK